MSNFLQDSNIFIAIKSDFNTNQLKYKYKIDLNQKFNGKHLFI